MNAAAKAYYVLRHLGPGFVARRITLDLKKRLGFTRRLYRSRPWDSIALPDILRDGIPSAAEEYARYKQSHLPTFLFPFGSPPSLPESCINASSERSPNLRERIEQLKADRCVYFFNQPSPEPIDWYHNPFENTRAPHDRVWCDIPDFLPSQGDPRVMWEPARAAWAMDLARAKARGWDDATPELFWRWVDSWMNACPPFDGFHWKCGQESSVRFIALMFGFWAFGEKSTKESKRWVQMARLAWATGFRVAHHIDYAVSQNNNHALSEACGLMVIAHLFPELRSAKQWNETGRRVLATAMRRQIYQDGSYIQHSMNYHRVMLQVCTLALQIAELGGAPMPRDLHDRLGKAAAFALQMSDETTGRTPNYGNNDGAWVLPFCESHFADFRPAIQSASYCAGRTLPLPPGPWDEETLWLFGDSIHATARLTAQRVSASFPTGGYFTLRRTSSWAMVRCHSYADRPSQFDPLHLDLWWNGVNILKDRGTFRYYNPSAPELESMFRGLAAHNTIEMDDSTPVEWAGRFLYFPFPHAWSVPMLTSDRDDCPLIWSGVALDYARSPWKVAHTRNIICLNDRLWLVVDELRGRNEHAATLRWQLPRLPVSPLHSGVGAEVMTSAGPFVLAIIASAECSVKSKITPCPDAPIYNLLEQASTLEVTGRGLLPMRFVSAIFLGCRGEDIQVQWSDSDTIAVRCGQWQESVRFVRQSNDSNNPIIVGVECQERT